MAYLRYEFILFSLALFYKMVIKRRKDQPLYDKSKRSRTSLTSLQKREICVVKCEYSHAQVESNIIEEAEIRPTISLHQAVTGLKTLTQFLQYSTGLQILPEDIAALYRVQS